MALTKFTKDVEYISKLDNYPPDDEGMTSAKLKGLFDAGSVDIQDFINNMLIPQIETEFSATLTLDTLQTGVNLALSNALTSGDFDGADGREITLGVGNGYIRWQYAGESTWNNLIALSALVGQKGTGISSIANVSDAQFRITLTDGSYYDIQKPPVYNLAISVKNQLMDESQLPTSDDIGSMYLVNQDLYIYTANGWINVGSITGIDYDLLLHIDCGLFTDEGGGTVIGESALEELRKHIIDEATHLNLIIDGQEDYAE